MRIAVHVDPALLLLRLRNGEKRLAFAVVNAINDTAKLIQKAERERVEERFTLRKPDFVLRQAAVIKPFASVGQGRAHAEISVGQKPRLLLSQYEVGGERKPFKGKSVAVPVIGGPARPSFEQPVPEALQFRRLRFRLRPAGATKRRVRKSQEGQARVRYGEQGTYLVPGVGVFQRPQGAEGSRLIYAFVQGEELPRKLDFVETASGVADRWFRRFLEAEVTQTLARHAGRG